VIDPRKRRRPLEASDRLGRGDRGQHGGDGGGARRARRGVLVEEHRDQGVEGAGHVGPGLAHPPRRLGQVLVDELTQVRRDERRPPAEQLDGDDPDGVEITRWPDLPTLPGGLLR
jgi:hypothetical protein